MDWNRRKVYVDGYGNDRCSICGSKIEGGYCDCIAYEIQKERAQQKKNQEESKGERHGERIREGVSFYK